MSSEAITRLRALFETELAAHPDLYHPVDIERVRTEEWQVKRFLVEFGEDNDGATAFAQLLKTLQWKKEFGLHERTDQYFPQEIWRMTATEVAGRDKEGHIVCWEASREQRSFKETALLMRQFAAHILERNDRLAGPEGAVFVGDTNGSSVWNIDSSLEQFKIGVLEHYPAVIKALYIVDVPWLLNAVIKLIMSFMNPKMKALVTFVSAAQLADYIDPQYIPVSIKGGQRKESTQPEGLRRLEELAGELGLEAKFVDNFYKTTKYPRGGN